MTFGIDLNAIGGNHRMLFMCILPESNMAQIYRFKHGKFIGIEMSDH